MAFVRLFANQKPEDSTLTEIDLDLTTAADDARHIQPDQSQVRSAAAPASYAAAQERQIA